MVKRYCYCGCGKELPKERPYYLSKKQNKPQKFIHGHNILKGDKPHNFKGGTINHDGYKVIYVNGIRMKEHRFIVEKHLNRKLTKDEHIHHRNGNRQDNRIENLQVTDVRQYNTIHKLLRCEKGS